MFDTILAIIIVFSLGWLGFLVYRRFSDIKTLDVDALEKEKQGNIKNSIIQAKLNRRSQSLKKKVDNILKDRKKLFASNFDRFKEWLEDLEEKYNISSKDKEEKKSVKDILEEASKFIEQENYSEAEKKLIEVIAQDKRNITAYKYLGELYFDRKDYDQAQEIYNYLVKLYISKEKRAGNNDLEKIKSAKLEDLEPEIIDSLDVDPDIGLCYDHLAEIYEITEKKEKALDCYLKASSISPNNPKYLDKLISLSIEFKDKGLARRALNRLHQINPDNAKLTDYRKAIEKI